MRPPGDRIAIIGGGICGLTAALRLAENGFTPDLFEAAPEPGGRTRSFADPVSGEWVDNGPHLINGAYSATLKLLADCDASDHLSWQDSLSLPLWDAKRGHFSFKPDPRLPFPLALALAIRAMPGQSWRAVLAMARLHRVARRDIWQGEDVAQLMHACRAPAALIRDLFEPICLGAMNEGIGSADAASFARVLQESFGSAPSARLGWFNRPIQHALIEPVTRAARRVGARVHHRQRVRSLIADRDTILLDGRAFDQVIIAVPAYARNRLLNIPHSCATRSIINLHLWYRDHPGLADPFIGGIDTCGQWYFDITRQMNGMNDSSNDWRHLCAVISGVEQRIDTRPLIDRISREICRLSACNASPCHSRLIIERRATVQVRAQARVSLPEQIIDASEQPQPGELPATIESAVRRGEEAAQLLINQRFSV